MAEDGQNLGFLGSVVSMLGPSDKVTQRLYSKGLGQFVTKDLLPSAREDLANRRAAQNLYQQRLRDSAPEAERISGLRTGYLERGITDTENFDAFNQVYRPLGDYLFGQMNAVAPAAVGLTKSADDARRIGLGIRPGGMSSYVDAARTKDIGELLSRNFAAVLGTIGNDTGRLLASRAGERATGLGMLDTLAAEPDRLAYRELLPAYAAQDLQAGDIENAQRMIEAFRSNVAGFESNPTTIGRIARGLGGIYNSVWESAGNAASIYGSLLGGGAGGMMGGGGGGGGMGNPSAGLGGAGGGMKGTFMPVSGSAPAGGSGGGLDMATVMQLVQMLRGNPSQQSNPFLRPTYANPGVSNWGDLNAGQQFDYSNSLANANAWNVANPGPWE